MGKKEIFYKLKDAFAKAKANSYILSCNNDSTNWTYDKIINEYRSKNDIIIDVNIDIIKDIHYSRNDYNTYNGGKFPNTINEEIKNNWNDKVPANYHQNSRLKSGENKKYIDSTKRLEVIYDNNGKLVVDPKDIGTYNFAPSDSNMIFDIFPNLISIYEHNNLDVLPWREWGNSADDNSSWESRHKWF